MTTKRSLLAAGILALLCLAYAWYLGCALGAWRALLIEGARCAR